jgi:hypothetical protein
MDSDVNIKNARKIVMDAIVHEVARYEAMSDEAFDRVLDRLMEERLKALF